MTFTFAGQPIAVKVEGDPTSNNNGIFYFHNDHLGSTSVLTKDSDGYVLGSSVVRYYPFGGYRDAGAQELTDRGYTGHKENLDIGLIYMNARFYVPSVARFASADTIVPDPANPQSYNRYSYTLNNPVRYTDPTGHCAEEGDEECWALAEQISSEYGIDLDVIGILDMNEMRFFVEGLNASASVDNSLPEQIIDILNGLENESIEFLRQNKFDILGIRIEGGGGFIVGVQGDIDILFNFDSWETSIMVTPGIQLGAIFGASAGVGVYAGFNASKNSDLWGLGWGITLSYASGPGGAIQYNDSGDPWSIVLGLQGGAELDITVGGGYTFEIFNYVGNPEGTSPGYSTWFPQWWYLQGWLAGR